MVSAEVYLDMVPKKEILDFLCGCEPVCFQCLTIEQLEISERIDMLITLNFLKENMFGEFFFFFFIFWYYELLFSC